MVATTTTDTGCLLRSGISEPGACPPGRDRMDDVSADVGPGPPSSSPRRRDAVIGAGPAGIYAGEALAQQQEFPVAVVLLERLPTPFGLERHGIAPDDPKRRAIRDTLH